VPPIPGVLRLPSPTWGSLATTTPTDAERDALDLLVASLERELGDALHAVWLYGSRARGEPPRDEDSDGP
jgi:predicted nucleotidyltransferase